MHARVCVRACVRVKHLPFPTASESTSERQPGPLVPSSPNFLFTLVCTGLRSPSPGSLQKEPCFGLTSVITSRENCSVPLLRPPDTCHLAGVGGPVFGKLGFSCLIFLPIWCLPCCILEMNLLECVSEVARVTWVLSPCSSRVVQGFKPSCLDPRQRTPGLFSPIPQALTTTSHQTIQSHPPSS